MYKTYTITSNNLNIIERFKVKLLYFYWRITTIISHNIECRFVYCVFKYNTVYFTIFFKFHLVQIEQSKYTKVFNKSLE